MIKLFIPILRLLPVFIFVACANGRKLEVVQGQVQELTEQNRQLKTRVTSMQGELTNCNASISTSKEELERYREECDHTKEKLEASQQVLKDQYAIMHQIEEKIEDALADFKDKGVEVYYRKGFVHVSMEDNLLYKSGSSKLEEKGRKALSNLATVLNDYPNLKVIVLGNTDDVKFKNGMDNWTLSTERANGVVRSLRDDYKLDPARLTAAGKGKYNPVAENTTEEGRAKNRRTDIILNPDLDRLWDSIEGHDHSINL